VFCLLVVLVKLSVLSSDWLESLLWGNLTMASPWSPLPRLRPKSVYDFLDLLYCLIVWCICMSPGPMWYISCIVHLRSAECHDMLVPSTRTQLGRWSFHVAAPATWNMLPPHLRSPSISRGQFRPGLTGLPTDTSWELVHYICTPLVCLCWKCS